MYSERAVKGHDYSRLVAEETEAQGGPLHVTAVILLRELAERAQLGERGLTGHRVQSAGGEFSLQRERTASRVERGRHVKS